MLLFFTSCVSWCTCCMRSNQRYSNACCFASPPLSGVALFGCIQIKFWGIHVALVHRLCQLLHLLDAFKSTSELWMLLFLTGCVSLCTCCMQSNQRYSNACCSASPPLSGVALVVCIQIKFWVIMDLGLLHRLCQLLHLLHVFKSFSVQWIFLCFTASVSCCTFCMYSSQRYSNGCCSASPSLLVVTVVGNIHINFGVMDVALHLCQLLHLVDAFN